MDEQQVAPTLDYEIDNLPNWNANALAAIGAALLRCGELEKGRCVLQQVRLFKPQESEDWRNSMRMPPWALAVSASAEGGDIEGAIAILKHLPEPSDRSLGLILIGEIQAESGDDEAAWNTFQAAVAESGEPGEPMDATSLSDIGFAAAWSRKRATARLISTRAGSPWLTQCLEWALQSGLSLGSSLAWVREFDPAWELRHTPRQGVFLTNSMFHSVEELAATALNFWEDGKQQEAEGILRQAKGAACRIVGIKKRSHAWFSIMSVYLAVKEWACAMDCAKEIPDLAIGSSAFRLITKIQTKQGDIKRSLATVEYAEELMQRAEPDDSIVNDSRIDICLIMAATLPQETYSNLIETYFARAWQSASAKVHNLIPWTRTERLVRVITAIAKAGYVKEAIRRYKEAASEV